LLQSRTADWVARTRADDELRSRGEISDVEIFGHAAVAEAVGVANTVGPLYRESQARVVVSGLSHRHRIAGLHANQAGHLPPRNLPKTRDLIYEAQRENPRNVTAGNVFFQVAVERIGGARAVENRAAEDGLREDAGRVVDQLGKCECGVDVQA